MLIYNAINKRSVYITKILSIKILTTGSFSLHLAEKIFPDRAIFRVNICIYLYVQEYPLSLMYVTRRAYIQKKGEKREMF